MLRRIQAKAFSRPGMCRPPAGDLCGAEDVNHNVGGGGAQRTTRSGFFTPAQTRLPPFLFGTKSDLITPLRDFRFHAGTAASSFRAHLPPQTAASFRAPSSDEAPPDADLFNLSWCDPQQVPAGPRWPIRTREPDLSVAMVH